MLGDFNVNPDFSVYNLVGRVREDVAVVNHRRTMTAISHEIENASLVDGAQTTIFSGFQRLSRFMRQEKRYRQLAKNAKAIYVFGEPDITPPEIEKIIYIPLQPTDELTKEWFLVSYGTDFVSALATREITHIDDPDEQRIFNGIWTFEIELAAILHQWLSGVVGLRPELVTEEFNRNQQMRLIGNIIVRMTHRLDKLETSPRNAVLHSELNIALKNRLQTPN